LLIVVFLRSVEFSELTKLMEELQASRNAQAVSTASGEQKTEKKSLFFVGIICTGNGEQLTGTIRSVLRQKLTGGDISIYVFHDLKTPAQFITGEDIVYVPFQTPEDFYCKVTLAIEQSQASYCSLLWAGDELFDRAYNSMDQIFKEYKEINWITGIQTFRAQGGFNIALGSTAMRRWSNKIYERNIYKNSGRYIPPASTVWRKNIWSAVSSEINFVSQQTFFDDLWFAFLKSQKLYACKVYFSSSPNYENLDGHRIKQPNSYIPIEESLIKKIGEFFFINNVPYLRLFYKSESDLTPVIRFNHNTQSFFLSEY
jgi:hypothetical protein